MRRLVRVHKLTQGRAIEVIEFVKSKGIEIRFSSEDSFRSELVDLLSIYRTVDKIGVNRVGVADTVGCADARQVYDLVRTLRGVVSCDIETHFHNDTGCAIANAYAALEAGATHIDTSVLGIGERNGITPLGGLIARMMAVDPEYVKSKYNLPMLREIENYVAEQTQISVPFNNYITGFCAFTHKAGIHAKAILANPSTYEILNPADFGMTRYVSIGHRLTGWNAVKSRVDQLGLSLTDEQVKDATAKIKALADVRTQSSEDVDMILRVYHQGVKEGQLKIGQSAVLDKLLEEVSGRSTYDEPALILHSTWLNRAQVRPTASGVRWMQMELPTGMLRRSSRHDVFVHGLRYGMLCSGDECVEPATSFASCGHVTRGR